MLVIDFGMNIAYRICYNRVSFKSHEIQEFIFRKLLTGCG
jgi:hypothetical protein